MILVEIKYRSIVSRLYTTIISFRTYGTAFYIKHECVNLFQISLIFFAR